MCNLGIRVAGPAEFRAISTPKEGDWQCMLQMLLILLWIGRLGRMRR
jgi:hypothetical protein